MECLCWPVLTHFWLIYNWAQYRVQHLVRRSSLCSPSLLVHIFQSIWIFSRLFPLDSKRCCFFFFVFLWIQKQNQVLLFWKAFSKTGATRRGVLLIEHAPMHNYYMSKTATGMDRTLHTDLWKSETSRDIRKSILMSLEHL